MKSLKELIASNIALSERELNLVEAEFVLAVIMNMRSETSDYDVEDNKLKHWHKETKGLITREYINRKLFKETMLYENGNKASERYYKNGKLHRDDGPAVTEWYENGNVWSESWYRNDKLHREDGPAMTEWSENGNKIYETRIKNGNLYFGM